MPIAIAGAGTVTGISAGGLPDGCIQEADLAAGVNTIKHAEQWRVNSNFSGATTPITNNWERVDGTAQGGIGTNFSAPSSGAWTFPATGIWWVSFQAGFSHTSDIQWVQIDIKATTSDQNYASSSIIANGWADLEVGAGTHYNSIRADTFVDVTDVSQVKVYFGLENQVAPTYQSFTATNSTYATFIRLGDT
tara:strand:- start:169 stop:744 length:576 start_codon:yes stop_codon:yes gene_type:complete